MRIYAQNLKIDSDNCTTMVSKIFKSGSAWNKIEKWLYFIKIFIDFGADRHVRTSSRSNLRVQRIFYGTKGSGDCVLEIKSL